MNKNFKEIIKELDDDTEEKRKKILDKINTLEGGELQIIYQSLFFDEIIDTFNRLPKPARQLTDKEIDNAIFKSRKEQGFYSMNVD